MAGLHSAGVAGSRAGCPPNSAQQGAQHLQRLQSHPNCWRLFCPGSLPPYVCSGPLSRHRELLQHPQGGRPLCQGGRGGAHSWARPFRGSGVELPHAPPGPPHLLALPAFKTAAKQVKIRNPSAAVASEFRPRFPTPSGEQAAPHPPRARPRGSWPRRTEWAPRKDWRRSEERL